MGIVHGLSGGQGGTDQIGIYFILKMG